MRQKELEKWLKIVIIAVALCGLVVCAVAIPWIGHVLIAPDPQISDMYIPWLVLFIISAIPCYVICESSGGDTGSCVHSVCLCCGIGRGGGFVTSCGKGRRSAGAE